MRFCNLKEGCLCTLTYLKTICLLRNFSEIYTNKSTSIKIIKLRYFCEMDKIQKAWKRMKNDILPPTPLPKKESEKQVIIIRIIIKKAMAKK